MNFKVVLLVISGLLITNFVTYKVTYQHAKTESFLANVAVDIMKLKMYDETGICDDRLTLNIEGLFVAAAESENVDKFSSICKVFKKEYFDIVDELSSKYPPIIVDQELYKKIEIGKTKMKKLCNVSE